MFWLHEEELPEGVGSEPFCAAHLAYLAVFLALTAGYAVFYRRLSAERRKTADRVLGSCIFFFGLCEYGITALLGHFSLYTLPIHVCSLMYSFAPLHAWTNAARPGSFAAGLHRFLGAALFHPGVPGTLAALLFPDWLVYPFWNYMSICGFLSHGLILVYGASLLMHIAEAEAPRGLFLRDLRASALFMGLGALVMVFFDRATGTNYWFMAGPSADSPFLGAWVRGGYGGYLLAYALTALIVTALWYGLRYLLFVRGRTAPGRADIS
ncbi:MAG: YwaF family protein [Oscillospiraceae bacterium]|nr:YwaF family protein [Oscillospiraceae bacterium]